MQSPRLQADARVLRTVLSLMGENDRLLKGVRRGLRGHIVAELADIDNEPLVRMVGTDNCGVYTVTRCGWAELHGSCAFACAAAMSCLHSVHFAALQPVLSSAVRIGAIGHK